MQCPHCKQHFHEQIHGLKFSPGDAVAIQSGESPEIYYGVEWTRCAACNQIVLFLLGLRPQRNDRARQIIWPKKALPRPPLPAEVPERFAAEYREACLTLADSPKASAALSRRCLQELLHEIIGIKEKDLNSEIQKLLASKTLPPHLAENVDAIRTVGNFAAHPIKSTSTGEVVPVEPGEAEWLLEVLEGLFEFYLVQPARSRARREALNKKLSDAGKPPIK